MTAAMIVAAGSNNAFAINGFTGMSNPQIVSFFFVFLLFNGFVVLEAISLAAFYVTAKPRHGRIRTAAIWHFYAALLVMVAFISTVWGAPAEKSFVNTAGDSLTLQQTPNIQVLGLGLGRADMLFVGIIFAGGAVLCMLIGFIKGAQQKRVMREEAYALA